MDAVGHGPVALDTSAFIYLIEDNPAYRDVLVPLFVAADLGEVKLVSSALTLLEVLVVPYRLGNFALAERYERFLTGSKTVALRDIDQAQLRAAAQIRAVSGVRTPDALQLAVALTESCSSFVTNDRRLARFPGVRVLVLDDYI